MNGLNGFLCSAEKRFSKGLTLLASYTWSNPMDSTSVLNAQDPMPYESLSSIDRAHRVTGSGIWELPFGRGRHLGNKMSRWADLIVAGSQLSGALQRQSGQPIDWRQMIIFGDSTKLALPSDQRTGPLVQHLDLRSRFRRPTRQQHPYLPAALQQCPF